MNFYQYSTKHHQDFTKQRSKPETGQIKIPLWEQETSLIPAAQENHHQTAISHLP